MKVVDIKFYHFHWPGRLHVNRRLHSLWQNSGGLCALGAIMGQAIPIEPVAIIVLGSPGGSIHDI